jgi:uncharacterized protein YaeQ
MADCLDSVVDWQAICPQIVWSFEIGGDSVRETRPARQCPAFALASSARVWIYQDQQEMHQWKMLAIVEVLDDQIRVLGLHPSLLLLRIRLVLEQMNLIGKSHNGKSRKKCLEQRQLRAYQVVVEPLSGNL